MQALSRRCSDTTLENTSFKTCISTKHSVGFDHRHDATLSRSREKGRSNGGRLHANSRFDPARDTEIIEDVFFPMGMDPSIRVKDGTSDPGSKIVIDATETIDAGLFSLPSKEKMTAALDAWKEAGLPEFSIPKRARLRIERS